MKLLFLIDTIAAPDVYAKMLKDLLSNDINKPGATTAGLLTTSVECLGEVQDLSSHPELLDLPAAPSETDPDQSPVEVTRMFRVRADARVEMYDVSTVVEHLERGSLDELIHDDIQEAAIAHVDDPYPYANDSFIFEDYIGPDAVAQTPAPLDEDTIGPNAVEREASYWRDDFDF